jgi:hypothetical protein
VAGVVAEFFDLEKRQIVSLTIVTSQRNLGFQR